MPKKEAVVPGGVPDTSPRFSLDWSPKKNFWDKVGGLPKYIASVATALIQDRGMDRGRAIATAKNRVEHWCLTGHDNNLKGNPPVSKAVQAAACKAIAEWKEKLARAKTKNVLSEEEIALLSEEFEPFECPTEFGEDEEGAVELEELLNRIKNPEFDAETAEKDEKTDENPPKTAENAQELPETLLERITGLFQELQAATVDAVGRVWRGSDHPRGPGGTFSPKAGGEQPTNRAEIIKNLFTQMDLGELAKYRGQLLQAALQAAQTGEVDTGHFSSMPDALQQQALEVVASVLEQAGLKKKEASQGSQNMSEDLVNNPPAGWTVISNKTNGLTFTVQEPAQLSEDEPHLYRLPAELSEATRLGNRRFRKRLIPVGKKVWDRDLKEYLDFSRETLKKMRDNFYQKAYDLVPLTDGHADSVKAYLGEVVDVELDNEWLSVVCEVPEETAKLLDNSPKLPTSAGYWRDYFRKADKRAFGPTLQHVAALFKPHVPGGGTWAPVQLTEDEAAVVVDLTEAEFANSESVASEAADTPREERDPVSDVDVQTPKEEQEEVEVTLEERLSQLEQQLEEEKNAREAERTRREQSDESVRDAQKTLRRQGIRKMLNENYVANGVPAAKANAAFELLSVEEGFVTLSEEGDASVTDSPQAKAVIELLEGYKGTLKFGEEGTSEETEELDEETRLDKRTRVLMSEKGIDYSAALDIALLEEEVK